MVTGGPKIWGKVQRGSQYPGISIDMPGSGLYFVLQYIEKLILY